MYINWFPDAFISVLLKWLKFIGILEKKKVPTNVHLISDSLFYSFDRQPFSESISHCLVLTLVHLVNKFSLFALLQKCI